MNFLNKNCSVNLSLPLFTFGVAIFLLSAQLSAQDDIDPGGIDPPVVDTPVVDNTDTFSGGGGGTSTTDNNDTVDIDDASSLDLGSSGIDNRNQGFVGATAPGISENIFVGAASQTFGDLADGASFGGGVNDRSTNSIPSGAGGGNAGAGRGGAGGFTGTSSGSVIRSSLRTRLRPAFAAPVVPPQVTEFNFNDNLARQPSAQSLLGRYQVSIENKTATVVGVVNSQADADRLIRQLKLQPGIYGIVNQLQVIE